MADTIQETFPEKDLQSELVLPLDLISPWDKDEQAVILLDLVEKGKQIVQVFTTFGDRYFSILENDEAVSILQKQKSYFVTYHWPERAKAFLLLWRDTLLEEYKGFILKQDGVIDKEKLALFRDQSKEGIQTAAVELANYLPNRIRQARRKKNSIDKQIRALRLQQNPWPVYRKQILDIENQLQQLLGSHHLLKETQEAFGHLKNTLDLTLSSSQHELKQHLALATRAIHYVEGQNEFKSGKIAIQFEEFETQIQIPNFLSLFIEASDKYTDQLSEKNQIPAGTQGGLILCKEINFQRSVKQWMESEILPALYEIWELTELDGNGLKMSFLNIRNRLLLITPESKEGKIQDLDPNDLIQPLHNYIKNSANTDKEIQALQTLIEDRLQENFRLSNIFNSDDNFLPIPLQSTIKQLRVNQNVVVSGLRKWVSKQTKALRRFQRSVEIEESLSLSEKIVRYFQCRNSGLANAHYNSIFMTKGYIGESFCVGRKDELEHLAKLIQDWKEGFRGAVLLSGERLSGKSLIGELAINRYFSQNSISLAPQSIISVQGRRIKTTYNLEECLAFIRKHMVNVPCLVWIDDLELWQDPATPLGKNVEALRQYIDNYGNQIFFLIAMSNALRHHLEKCYDLLKIFQAEINLDKIPLADMRDAIMIRHGATHKNLVDEKGRDISPQQFQKMTAKVHKSTHGNIGEALNIWAFSTRLVNEDQVIHDLSTLYELPDFISSDTGLLLSSIILSKKTNEYRLRKLFGPSFLDRYRSVLQRLISVGLLHRSADGWLEINEWAVNDLGRLLEPKRYLKYQR